MISLIRSMLCRSVFCLIAAIIRGPEARIRRNDSLIALGSCSPTSPPAPASDVRSLGPPSTGPAPGGDSGSAGAGLVSLSRFFVSGLPENSTLNGGAEDDAAAWLLKSAPHRRQKRAVAPLADPHFPQ